MSKKVFFLKITRIVLCVILLSSCGDVKERPPKLTTTEVTAITINTAIAVGYITDAGIPAYTERGVCYATFSSPKIDGEKVVVTGTGTGEYIANLAGLTHNTKYYVRAYATNSNGTVYGNEVSFTTLIDPVASKQMTITMQPLASVKIKIGGSGTMTINWGDGKESETHTLKTYTGMLDDNRYFYSYSGSTPRIVTISGQNITHIRFEDNGTYILTELDVRYNTSLMFLYCCKHQLRGLDVSGNTNLYSLSIRSNNLSSPALNSLFESLHDNDFDKGIDISFNPGTDNCNKKIAENKGWSVYAY